MRDALSRRSGDGAPEPPSTPPGPPPAPDPPIPPRPTPQRTRGRPERAVTADPRAPPPSTTPRITPGRRTRTPSQQPSGRGGPARADRHHNLHAPRLQNHPRIIFPAATTRTPPTFGPTQADPGTGRGRCGSDPDCVMRAQRDAVHPASRRASPARRNPPALDSCEPAWRNASPGDITNSTPPGLAPGSSGGDAPGPGPRSGLPGAGARARGSRGCGRASGLPRGGDGPAGAAGAAGLGPWPWPRPCGLAAARIARAGPARQPWR